MSAVDAGGESCSASIGRAPLLASRRARRASASRSRAASSSRRRPGSQPKRGFGLRRSSVRVRALPRKRRPGGPACRPESIARTCALLDSSWRARRLIGSVGGGWRARTRRGRVERGGEVEVVAVAAAAEGDVGPFAVDAFVGEHEGLVDGQALGDVAGDRVAVQRAADRRRWSARRGSGVEPDSPAAAVDLERPGAGSTAVTRARSPLLMPRRGRCVCTTTVADRERAARQSRARARARQPRACALGRGR